MKISDEQKMFLVENYENNTIEELSNLFFVKYGIRIDKSQMGRECRSIGLKRGKGAKGRKRKSGATRNVFMKKEKDDFIKQNIDTMPFSQLCDTFRLKFGDGISNNAISARISRLGYKRTKNYFDYTKDNDSFLIENFERFNYEELKNEFDKKFNTDISIHSLKHRCNEILGLKKTKRLKIGEETKRNGREMVKVSNGKCYYNYIDKNRFVYQKECGEIPDGYRVVCLDGNKKNCNPDNLYLVSRRELSVLAGCKWMGKERNNMMEKIKYAQLRCALLAEEEE